MLVHGVGHFIRVVTAEDGPDGTLNGLWGDGAESCVGEENHNLVKEGEGDTLKDDLELQTRVGPDARHEDVVLLGGIGVETDLLGLEQLTDGRVCGENVKVARDAGHASHLGLGLGSGSLFAGSGGDYGLAHDGIGDVVYRRATKTKMRPIHQRHVTHNATTTVHTVRALPFTTGSHVPIPDRPYPLRVHGVVCVHANPPPHSCVVTQSFVSLRAL